jgi:hypothetical protein
MRTIGLAALCVCASAFHTASPPPLQTVNAQRCTHLLYCFSSNYKDSSTACTHQHVTHGVLHLPVLRLKVNLFGMAAIHLGRS